jgi:hypothetical protein
MRRGVFRGDYVYGISTQAVYAQQVSALAEPVAIRASLPPATYYDYYESGPGVIAGTAGAAGVGAAGTGSSADSGEAGSANAASGGAGGAPSDVP